MMFEIRRLLDGKPTTAQIWTKYKELDCNGLQTAKFFGMDPTAVRRRLIKAGLVKKKLKMINYDKVGRTEEGNSEWKRLGQYQTYGEYLEQTSV